MSDSEHTHESWPDTDAPTIASADPALEATSDYPTLVAGVPAGEPAGDSLLEEGDEWPERGPARGIRLGLPAAVLVAVFLVAAGFWGGAALQKSHASPATAGGFAALASRFRGAQTGATGATGATGSAGGGFGFPGGASGGSNATTGTVSIVDGETLYVLTGSNQLVKVVLGPSTTVTRNAKAKTVELRPGDTVSIEGTTGNGGTVTASSVSATAPGVSSIPAGFGGGGLGGGSGGQGIPSQGASAG